MTRLTRADVVRMIEGSTGPEGGDGSPMLLLHLTPQAALLLMDDFGAATIEADVILPAQRPSEAGLRVAPVIPPGRALPAGSARLDR